MKTAIITGGTSGIGLAAAKIFLQNGINVILVGRNKDRYTAAHRTLKPYLSNVFCDFIQADVASAADCKK